MRSLTPLTTMGLALAAFTSAYDSNTNYCRQLAEAFASQRQAPARLAFDCQRSVPLNKTAALEFVTYFNDTILNWHTTTVYLKNPPPSYQRPSVDLYARLSDIKDKINNGTFMSHFDVEYEFDALIQSSHDGHLAVITSAISALSYSAEYSPASISVDGKKLPDIYAYRDVIDLSNSGGHLDWEPASMKTINGKDAVEFLTEYSDTYVKAGLDPHADWNALMSGPYESVLGSMRTLFQGNTRYNGDWMNITFANGTQRNTAAFATPSSKSVSKWGNVTNAQDFYDLFVRPSSQVVQQALIKRAKRAADAQGSKIGWPAAAFPPASIVQANLSQASGVGGYGTGYILGDLAVFYLPSFSMVGADAANFQGFVRDFIKQAKAAQARNIMFDIGSNGGGTFILALELFKQFFPGSYPYNAGRARYNNAANVLGEFCTEQYDTLKNTTAVEPEELNIVALPYTATSYLNANTHQLFKTWAELAETYDDNGDRYMQTQLFDYSNEVQDWSLTANGFVVSGFGKNVGNASDPQPWAVEDMAILTDGRCGSTCAVFMELFKNQMNVTTIAIGGLPQAGPSQIAGGVRGNRASPQALISLMVNYIAPQLSADQRAILPNVDAAGFAIEDTSFNSWDLVRENETFPQQFAYQAADCRIFWTPETINNMTNLWQYAAMAVWQDRSLCIEGSTGQPSSLQPYFTDTCGPIATAQGCKQDDVRWGTSGQTYHVNDIPPEAYEDPTEFAKDSERNATASEQSQSTNTAIASAGASTPASSMPSPSGMNDVPGNAQSRARALKVETTGMVILLSLCELLLTL